jgi:hypothetical protein
MQIAKNGFWVKSRKNWNFLAIACANPLHLAIIPLGFEAFGPIHPSTYVKLFHVHSSLHTPIEG